jgi:type II secretory pathway pseudopilin PulG
VWTSKIFWKLFLVYTGLAAALTVAFLVSLSTWQRKVIVEQTAQGLKATAQSLIKAAAAENPSDLRTALVTEVEAAQRDTQQSLVLVDEVGRVIAGAAAGQDNLSSDAEIRSERQTTRSAPTKGAICCMSQFLCDKESPLSAPCAFPEI